MSSISSLGGFQNPQQINNQGTGAKPASGGASDAGKADRTQGPTDTDSTQGAVDVQTQALIKPDLTNDQARAASREIQQQLSGQALSIANRAPQALQSAFGG